MEKKKKKEKKEEQLVYVVAERQVITSRRGMLKHGDVVEASFLANGQEDLDRLVELKVLAKKQ